MSIEDKAHMIDFEMKIDPTLPTCFKVKADQVSAFTVDAVRYMAHAHETHNELSAAIDMYVSVLVSMFHALPLEPAYLAQIKTLIDKRWNDQAVLMEHGIDALPMAMDGKKH